MSGKNKLQEYCQKRKMMMPIYSSWSSGEQHNLRWSASVTITLTSNKDITLETIFPSNSKCDAEKQVATMMIDYIKNRKNEEFNNSKKSSIQNDVQSSNHMVCPSSLRGSIQVPVSCHPQKILTDINIFNNNDDIEYQNEIDTNPSSIKTIYIIDLENKPFFRGKMDKNCLYIGFLNSTHHSVQKYNSWHKCKTDIIDKEILEAKTNKLLYLIDGGTADLVDHFMTAFLYPILDFIQMYNVCLTINIISGDHAGWCTRACLEKIIKWKKIINIEVNNSSFI